MIETIENTIREYIKIEAPAYAGFIEPYIHGLAVRIFESINTKETR